MKETVHCYTFIYSGHSLEIINITKTFQATEIITRSIFNILRTIVARRICLLIGLHYLYRSFTFFVTVLPKPDENFHCEKQLNHTSVVVILERFVTLATGFGLTINGNYVFCGDYIYSGHSTMLISCYLIIQGKFVIVLINFELSYI